ncbi:MAG: 16S rRNA (guanine(527)-N(7))-methyltransferase RsmG [Clostridiales bacterium]|nr:16S rRNA (guanine(527)-N(7))-methyltransferase RsmG [Clostridiales bacterium]
MDEKFFEVLYSGANELGIKLDNNNAKKFKLYKDLLKEWNERVNLTSILEDEDIAIKHFVDSMSICRYIKKSGATLIDVGTGAGFPSLPIKIVNKDTHVTLLDSLEKRTKFLNEVVVKLHLDDVDVVHGRAEDIGREDRYREKFDYACARAVAALPVLLEYCLPFVKTGGLFIAMKGSNVDEVSVSKNALDKLGGKIVDVVEFCLPNSDYKRNIVLIQKIKNTPSKYPRKAGKPSRMPL